MRIGLVLDRFEPLRGGREQWTYCFAQRLAARGHEVHIVSRELGEAVFHLPVALHRVACEKSPLAFAEAARRVIAPLGLEIVHDMGTGWYCDVFQPHGGTWAAVNDRKLLFLPSWARWIKRQVDRMLPRQRDFQKLMARQYADRGQIVLALSRAGVADFQRFHEVTSDRVRLVYNGVDTQRFSPERCAEHRESVRRELGIEPGTVLALLVAHNFRLKGVATLLRATARLTAEGLPLRLLVVGGKRLQSWHRMAQRLGAEKAVRFLGLVEDTLPYYAAADLYVHPTFYDACSLVVLEAAACGLPIITSRYNGAAELFQEDTSIRLISDPANSKELAASMRGLFSDRVRSRLGAAARRVALRHTFDDNVDQIMAVYQEVLDRRSGLPQGDGVWSARVGTPCPVRPAEGPVAPTRQPQPNPGVFS